MKRSAGTQNQLSGPRPGTHRMRRWWQLLMVATAATVALLFAAVTGVSADGSIHVGVRARVTAGTNVRSCAGTSCKIVGGLSTGDIVTVDGGPQNANGYRWWHTSRGGWSIDNNLTLYNPAPAPAPQAPHPAPAPAPQQPSHPAPPNISSLSCSGSVQTGQSASCNPSISGAVTSRSWSASGGSPSSGNGSSFSTSFSSTGSKSISLQACNGSTCSSRSQTIAVSQAPSAPVSDAVFMQQAQQARAGQRQPISGEQCMVYAEARDNDRTTIHPNGNLGAFNLLFTNNDAKLVDSKHRPLNLAGMSDRDAEKTSAAATATGTRKGLQQVTSISDFSQLRPGDLIVWDRGAKGADAGYGHVAVVEKADKDRVVLTMANWGASWKLFHRSDFAAGMYVLPHH